MVRPTKHPKSSVYRVRRAVPADLREVVGKRELIASLRTKDPAELPEGAADRERRALEIASQSLDGAQQRRKHRVGGELALTAQLVELADRDAEFARQRLRQRRQALKDRAQFVALQRARGPSGARRSQGWSGSFLGGVPILTRPGL